MKAQREAELKALQGRNELINKTLASWNRALGSSGNKHEIEELKAKLEGLAAEVTTRGDDTWRRRVAMTRGDGTAAARLHAVARVYAVR